MGVFRETSTNERSKEIRDQLLELGLKAGSLVIVKGELLVRWNDFADVNIDPSEFYLMEFVGIGLNGNGIFLNHDEKPRLYDDRPDYDVWGPQFLDALEQKLVMIEIGEEQNLEE